MTKRSSRRSSKKVASNTQRAVITGTTGAVLLIIALIAQYVFGINVLNTQEQKDATPFPTSVINNGSGTSVLTPIPGGYDGGWFQLYFTSPINTQDESRFVGSPVENAVVNLLNSATQTIDGAFYEMNSQPITDALINAHERGVRVRIVTDGEFGLEQPDTTVDQLEFAGIQVKSDGARKAFMHNKFFVVDGTFVWTGSTNFTHNDLYNNNNNSILIRSSKLAQNYATEFEELFGGKFGSTSAKTIPNPAVTIDGTLVETIFESEGDAPTRLAELFNSASSVQFMAFSFTEGLRYNDNGSERSLMDLLVQRFNGGGLALQGIVEASSRRFVAPLYCAGMDVKQDGNPDVLHHKVFIIDGSIVVMGSFNFSQNASTDNDENMLIIHNRDLAQAYLEEFARRWAEAQTMPKSAFSC
jgi:phosphatidylserine/phosphatidylglycerophosphate/cardiolipin synthase-like enzyme